MTKKETFWDLLARLDNEAGQFNVHLSEANRYFDKVEKKTKVLLSRHAKDLHTTISQVKKALKKFKKGS